MEKDDINNIIGLRKSTKFGNLAKSRTNQYTGKDKSTMGAQSSIHEKYKIGTVVDQLLKDDEIEINVSEADNDKFHQMHDNNQSSEMYNLYHQDEDQEEEIAQDDEITEKYE